MTTVNGLPAHVLLVHAIVVLLPLSALLLILTVAWAPARKRLAGPNALLALGIVVLVPITTSAGEWLERRVAPTDLVRAHTELGDTALFVAIGVAIMTVVVWWRGREFANPTRRRTLLAPASTVATAAIAVLSIAAGGIALYDVYRIGDSGAKASWDGKVAAQPTR